MAAETFEGVPSADAGGDDIGDGLVAGAPATDAAATATETPGALSALGEAERPQQQQEGQQQQSGYTRFREMLKHQSAQPVTVQLLDFVRKFPAGLSQDDAATRVHKFLTRMQEWMLSEVVVFAADADEEGRTNAAEGLEKFLLSRLHQKIFATDPKDLEEDALLQERCSSLSWVSFEQLGVPPVEPSLLTLAIKQLQCVDDYKAPRDKLVCILNASRVINDVLKRTLEDAGVAGRPLSADDFLPLLIYSVLQANPPRLHSNAEFVAAFRHPSRLHGEDAYFLTALQSAIAFVKEASHKALEVSEEDYQRLCADSLARAKEQREREQQQREASRPGSSGHGGRADGAAGAELEEEAGDEPDPLTATESKGEVATLAAKASDLSPAARLRLAEKVKVLPFLFEAVPSSRQLRISEVPGLLEEYREMAKLLREVERGGFDN